MLLSLYPTDTESTRSAVLDQALRSGAHELYTSLHIPEAADLADFGTYLAGLHHTHGLTFWADISPLTLDRLGLAVDAVSALRDWGVRGLRIDFGFGTDEVRALAASGGFPIAVNASTTTATELDALAGLDLVGWHNYYPRPETGLTTGFFQAQNALCRSRGLEVVAFVPGETDLRAPLHVGLPTLEAHRFRNAYRNAVELLRLGTDRLVYSEGTVRPEHLDWITHLERSGEITLPLADLDPGCEELLAGTWSLRPEETGVSWRIEGTRCERQLVRPVNADARLLGSLQADLPALGRYAGEVHLMTSDRPLTGDQMRVGAVAQPYVGIVDELRGRDRVRFLR